MRIGIIFDCIGPYHRARLTAASRLADISAIEIFASHPDYLWEPITDVEFDRTTLFGNPTTFSTSELDRHLRRFLARGRFDVLAVPGWFTSAALLGLRWAREHGIATVLMSASQESDKRRTLIRELPKSWIVGMCGAALVGGTSHARYVQRLGMKSEAVFTGYDAVDNDYFAQVADETRSSAEEWRRRLALPERYFLASSRFVRKKNLHRLMAAYAHYRRECNDPWDLVLLGDGVLRGDIQTLSKSLGMQGQVHLPGFRQYDELPRYYALAKAFVHASTTEQWGLVVNEAMASGLPILVSDRCGCTPDLLQEGVNGFSFDPLDTARLSSLFTRITTTVGVRQFGEASRNKIKAWGTDRFARALLNAAQYATTVAPQPTTAVESSFLWSLGILRLPSNRVRISSNSAADAPQRTVRTTHKLRIGVLFSSIGPYHAARLAALSKRADVSAIEVSNTDPDYSWNPTPHSGFDRQTLIGTDEAISFASAEARLRKALARASPDAIAVPGWFTPSAISALRWARAHDIPVLLMSDSQESDKPRAIFRENLKRWIVKQCSAAIVGGASHAKYIESLGMPAHAIFTGYDTVDNQYFNNRSAAARADDAHLRASLGLPPLYFLASTRFLPRKNIDRLVKAFHQYKTLLCDKAWHLVILGDGPTRDAILSTLQRYKLESHVHLPGFRQYDELPCYYGLAKVFIHASTTEQWGLVVNEAMASSLPVLVSNRCGCARELVRNNVNGFTFDPTDIDAITHLLIKMGSGELDLVEFGNASRLLIGNWSSERFALSVFSAASTSIATRKEGLTMAANVALKALSRRFGSFNVHAEPQSAGGFVRRWSAHYVRHE